jgi:predicted nucleic acid-binding protein
VSRYVVDASVAIKWYLPEIHNAEAQRLLQTGTVLLAPDLIFSEVGNILWKRVRASDLTEGEAEVVLQSLGQSHLAISPSWPLVMLALEIACQTQRTVYDSLYLALAVREKVTLVTADQKLYNAIHSTSLAGYVLWVEDIPSPV